MSYMLVRADSRRIPVADETVHCAVTSPPYFGLRDYGIDRQVGLESTPDEYVATMVSVFREVRRVLRDDGVCWLNLGDSYNNTDKWGGGGPNTGKQTVADDGSVPSWAATRARKQPMDGLKPKDLIGIPWRVAFALQADGWYLRSDVIWHKPNPMPESVTDRPTKAHEYLFLLTKSERYFYDAEAIAEAAQDRGEPDSDALTRRKRDFARDGELSRFTRGGGTETGFGSFETRNRRSVWTITTKPFRGSHFAVMPPDLVEPCIKAGASERGCCPACGAPWERVTESERIPTRPGTNSKVNRASQYEESPYHGHSGMVVGNRDPLRHCTVRRTSGWKPTCSCDAGDPVPCTVLDPFNGSGTSGVVALALGRRYIGLDLNPEYLAMAQKRIDRPHAPMRTAGKPEPMPLFREES